MEVQEDVPFTIAEVTSEWLSDNFLSAGLLDEGQITDIDVKVLGKQVGFNGEVAIISPVYSHPSQGAPRSMVLKIPTASRNRILGQTMGLYEKEIRFYRDLQSRLNIRAPVHYFSALDEADDPDVILKRIQGMNSLPIFLIRGLMALATWFVTGHPRNYVLLIEDLSDYRMGDQTVGCSDKDLKKIVESMARLHAQFWGSDELKTMSWIAPYHAMSRIMQMMFLQSVDRHIRAESANLSSDQLTMLSWLKEHGAALTERYCAGPSTLLHGDFRLDNICFDDENDEVILFDWQTMQAGPGGADLAYFVSSSLPLDIDEARVDEVIDIYHTELVREGVQVDRSEIRWQYDVGMMGMLHRILPTIYRDQMDLDAERGLPLLKAWIERIYARLAGFDIDTVNKIVSGK